VDHPTNGSTIKVKVVVINAMSYDVLMGGAIICPTSFTLDFWKETAFYKLG
jgi:hypothetical protein